MRLGNQQLAVLAPCSLCEEKQYDLYLRIGCHPDLIEWPNEAGRIGSVGIHFWLGPVQP